MGRSTVRATGLALCVAMLVVGLGAGLARDGRTPLGRGSSTVIETGPFAVGVPVPGPGGSPPVAVEGARRPERVVATVMPTLRSVAFADPRPSLGQLAGSYQHGFPAVAIDRRASLDDWRLSRPDPRRVSGYAGSISVAPGGTLDLHLRSVVGRVRLDVFRMGRDDATHVATLLGVAAGPAREARPDPVTGLVHEDWPVSTTLAVPGSWRSGVYLVRLTGGDGSQAYVPFVIRPPAARPLLVVLPTMTYAAYDRHGGASLYDRPGSTLDRATEVGFDRPFDHGWGAGDFFSLDFPLVVWLEDHGYEPAYATDVDVSRDPNLLTEASAVIFSGHPEYWTQALRDAADTAQARGVSLLDMGANAAFWQVRLAPGVDGSPDRTIVAYKDAALDPLRAIAPQSASARFGELPRPRPARQILGQDFGGIAPGLSEMILGPAVAAFAPESGLRPGDRLPGLLSSEVDAASAEPDALLLAATPIRVRRGSGPWFPILAGSSLWISPSGSHAFDAGTFDWSWGLDPRYAAGLPRFPAAGFARLTAAILAWAGVVPGADPAAPVAVASAPATVGYHPDMPHDASSPR